MTALAMIIGMLPMAWALGEGGEQNAPLGRAVIGGLLIATVATLFFVPDGVQRAACAARRRDNAAGSAICIGRLTGSTYGGQRSSIHPRRAAAENLRRIGLMAVLAAIAIAAFGILERRSHEAEVTQWTEQQAIPTVAVITPHAGAAVERLVLPGTVQAWYEAPIYARVPGYLKNWFFDYGAHVKKGDVLAEIETPDLDAQLAAAQAKLNSVRAVVKVKRLKRSSPRRPTSAGAICPRASSRCRNRKSKEADFNSARRG